MNKTQSLPLPCSVWVKDRHRPSERIRKQRVNIKLCEGTGVTGALSRGIRVQLRWTDISLQGERPEGWEWGRQGANWGEGGNYRHETTWAKARRENSPSNLIWSRSRITSKPLPYDAWPNVFWDLMHSPTCTLGSLSHQVPLSRLPPIQPCSLAMPTYDSLRATNAVPESARPRKHGRRNTELSMRSLRRLSKQAFSWASHKMALSPPQGLISTARIHKTFRPQGGNLWENVPKYLPTKILKWSSLFLHGQERDELPALIWGKARG